MPVRTEETGPPSENVASRRSQRRRIKSSSSTRRTAGRFKFKVPTTLGSYRDFRDGSQIRTANVSYRSTIRLWNTRTGRSEGQVEGIPIPSPACGSVQTTVT